MLPSKPWCDLGYFRKGFLRPDLGSWCFSWWPPFRLMKTSENIPHHEQVRIRFFFGCDVIWYVLIRYRILIYTSTWSVFCTSFYISIVLDPHEAYVPVAVPLWSVRQDDKSTSPTLPKTNSSHLNIGRVCPKRKLLVVSIFPSIFRRYVNFREVILLPTMIL